MPKVEPHVHCQVDFYSPPVLLVTYFRVDGYSASWLICVYCRSKSPRTPAFSLSLGCDDTKKFKVFDTWLLTVITDIRPGNRRADHHWRWHVELGVHFALIHKSQTAFCCVFPGPDIDILLLSVSSSEQTWLLSTALVVTCKSEWRETIWLPAKIIDNDKLNPVC